MSQQLGSEVIERQGKANKSTTPGTALSFQRNTQAKRELEKHTNMDTSFCTIGWSIPRL
jgi:hypothetical protein